MKYSFSLLALAISQAVGSNILQRQVRPASCVADNWFVSPFTLVLHSMRDSVSNKNQMLIFLEALEVLLVLKPMHNLLEHLDLQIVRGSKLRPLPHLHRMFI